jgi:hypothetical protein
LIIMVYVMKKKGRWPLRRLWNFWNKRGFNLYPSSSYLYVELSLLNNIVSMLEDNLRLPVLPTRLGMVTGMVVKYIVYLDFYKILLKASMVTLLFIAARF